MKKDKYIEIAIEIERIEKEYKTLDPGNSFEQERITLLKMELDQLLQKIKLHSKEERLSRFKIIEGNG